MKKIFTSSMLLLSIAAFAQNKDPELTEIWQPEPRVVNPGKTAADAPEDAIVLFNGKDFSEWQSDDGKPAKWKQDGDAMTVVKGAGVIKTKRNLAIANCILNGAHQLK
ncbi:DUF1080 domain-containing protein [Niabella ginsengisoli]|uniref:DUF1080 domain-containing protein n=1 Tax=Niabella ginsengisoli TaxID=522298 RepID=A0ABS9SLG7_9BACT|nr:DUF1080 domain-containing protein [Niabella ginsengisoli]MCH5599141.1 DUF1080 domain-containing protein [Niabella ginsengisoli]